jgi:HlyD family secretion protein
MKRVTRGIAIAVAGLGALGATTFTLLPAPLEVEAAGVAVGPLQVEVEGDGLARVREHFTVLAPVSGHLARITLQPGDEVAAGGEVATIGAALPPLLDRRSRTELGARAGAADAARREADAAIARARLAHDQALRELTRAERLADQQVIPARELEQLRFEERASDEAVEAAALAARTARREAEAATAALGRVDGAGAPERPERVAVAAPASGRVLRVLQPDEGPVAAGTPLLEIGDPSSLEVVVDLLTSDAVRVRPGAAAAIDQWGGREGLRGRVRRVEPSAFTKVSALGIEEQRVNVVIDPVPGPGWAALGDGYRVEVRIAVWEADRVLAVPSMALFRDARGWCAYALDHGRARLRRVEVGERGADATQVLAGLAEGDRVVLYPDDRLADGVAIAARE